MYGFDLSKTHFFITIKYIDLMNQIHIFSLLQASIICVRIFLT